VNARAVALRAQADALEAQARAVRAEADALEADAPERPAATDEDRVYITISEAARRFDVSRRTVCSWLAEGLPSVKRGRIRRIGVEAATAWIEGRRAAQ
jgi:excisionase family DNA binding protein